MNYMKYVPFYGPNHLLLWWQISIKALKYHFNIIFHWNANKCRSQLRHWNIILIEFFPGIFHYWDPALFSLVGSITFFISGIQHWNWNIILIEFLPGIFPWNANKCNPNFHFYYLYSFCIQAKFWGWRLDLIFSSLDNDYYKAYIIVTLYSTMFFYAFFILLFQI